MAELKAAPADNEADEVLFAFESLLKDNASMADEILLATEDATIVTVALGEMDVSVDVELTSRVAERRCLPLRLSSPGA